MRWRLSPARAASLVVLHKSRDPQPTPVTIRCCSRSAWAPARLDIAVGLGPLPDNIQAQLVRTKNVVTSGQLKMALAASRSFGFTIIGDAGFSRSVIGYGGAACGRAKARSQTLGRVSTPRRSEDVPGGVHRKPGMPCIAGAMYGPSWCSGAPTGLASVGVGVRRRA